MPRNKALRRPATRQPDGLAAAGGTMRVDISPAAADLVRQRGGRLCCSAGLSRPSSPVVTTTCGWRSPPHQAATWPEGTTQAVTPPGSRRGVPPTSGRPCGPARIAATIARAATAPMRASSVAASPYRASCAGPAGPAASTHTPATMSPRPPDQVPRAAAAQASSRGGARPIAARVRTSTTAPRRGAAAVTAGRVTAAAIPAAPARMAASHTRWLTAGPRCRRPAGSAG